MLHRLEPIQSQPCTKEQNQTKYLPVILFEKQCNVIQISDAQDDLTDTPAKFIHSLSAAQTWMLTHHTHLLYVFHETACEVKQASVATSSCLASMKSEN